MVSRRVPKGRAPKAVTKGVRRRAWCSRSADPRGDAPAALARKLAQTSSVG